MTFSRTGKILLYVVALILVAALTTWLGIQLTGSGSDWRHWLYQARFGLLCWRLALYLCLAASWLSLRRRLLQRYPACQRLSLRTAFLFFLLVAAAEYSNLVYLRGDDA
ncbi:hypothetical protein FJU30_25945 [Affinibrenneria salicis]|uniref:Uncharacterized protein n=1 Tax=Affinibrenneria salicis TaxID=2590031 RepID=A0A5J5FPZ5_9GAMM|nr:hypothetical protein [Affinibrenneria salicis]KAA8994690.1 hypothetical protein FJU30_25945 [Affinibrenneria salicis]